jgi:hypothetical protein
VLPGFVVRRRRRLSGQGRHSFVAGADATERGGAAAAARRRAVRKWLLWLHWELTARSYDMVLVRPGGWLLLRTRSLGGRAAAAAETNTLGPQGLKSGANRRPMALLNWAPPGATSWAVARAAWCLPRRPAPASIAVRRGRRWQFPN